MSFSPNIVGFACQWCTYAGADLAGNLRCKYPPTVKLIKVPCSGRVKPEYVLQALAQGADGVLVGGCHFGDCHYKDGNYKTKNRMDLLSKLIADMGFDPRRLRLEWISGAEGQKFAKVITEFTEELIALGPNPLKKEEELINE
ncbi:MAG: hydrogenase iron-sulfur subunit [Desulfobulbaceae bacterium]|jgi:F420-non-reducing hydrogenase iron-sulfur subunit|nr:hydrogenase iron-sulfur subunit [Desulfobulbaceae bacterium]